MLLNVHSIPSQSKELLGELVGKRIIRLIRYSWLPKEDVSAEYCIPESMVFSLTAGPLAILLEDGSIVGISSDPSLNSIVLWQDRLVEGDCSNPSALHEDEELFPVLSDDSVYADVFWQRLSDLTITSLSVLKKGSMTALELDRPSEIGLRFKLENGESFVASHGLHDGSDDFSVLVDEQIVEKAKIEESVLFSSSV